jgi:hypothetical protein
MEQSLLEEAFRAREDLEAQKPEEDPISEDSTDLLYVGHLTDTVTIGTHEIRIRTLRIGEELNAALLAKKYRDSIEEGRALATALVAASVTTVDGEALRGASLGPGEETVESKFDYILTHWYWDTVNTVFEAYNALLVRSLESLEELKKG